MVGCSRTWSAVKKRRGLSKCAPNHRVLPKLLPPKNRLLARYSQYEKARLGLPVANVSHPCAGEVYISLRTNRIFKILLAAAIFSVGECRGCWVACCDVNPVLRAVCPQKFIEIEMHLPDANAYTPAGYVSLEACPGIGAK